MGDLYKCKKCGQLCYMVSAPDVEGIEALEILKTIEKKGYIDSAEPIQFLETDFSQFLQKSRNDMLIRYTAGPLFSMVVENMHNDRVIIGTKHTTSEYATLSCPICLSEEFFSNIGSLPTTFVDGRWDNFVESDHIWYILSADNQGKGSFTELERRELVSHIAREDRLDAQNIMNDMIQEGYDSIVRLNNKFMHSNEVNLIRYFRVLLNIKTDIQKLEARLLDLILGQLSADRDYINSTGRSEETIVNEITKEQRNIIARGRRLQKELEFHMQEGWREAFEIDMPQEPVKPVLIKPTEPEYKHTGLFNRRQINAENDELRRQYQQEMDAYTARMREYEEAQKQYEQAKNEYDRKRNEVYAQAEDAWNRNVDNIRKKAELHDLRIRNAELDKMLQNPTKYAQRLLQNSTPAKIKRLFDEEIKRNTKLRNQAYQIEADLQTILFVLPKYLDIAAVAKIYEYLVTGRVSVLTGSNGAYKLYETELRNNRSLRPATISPNTENNAERDFSIYKSLSSVSKQMTEISQRTSAAIDELRQMNGTDAVEEYNYAIDSYYSAIEEELYACFSFSNEYIDREKLQKEAEAARLAEEAKQAEEARLKEEAEKQQEEEAAAAAAAIQAEGAAEPEPAERSGEEQPGEHPEGEPVPQINANSESAAETAEETHESASAEETETAQTADEAVEEAAAAQLIEDSKINEENTAEPEPAVQAEASDAEQPDGKPESESVSLSSANSEAVTEAAAEETHESASAEETVTAQTADEATAVQLSEDSQNMEGSTADEPELENQTEDEPKETVLSEQVESDSQYGQPEDVSESQPAAGYESVTEPAVTEEGQEPMTAEKPEENVYEEPGSADAAETSVSENSEDAGISSGEQVGNETVTEPESELAEGSNNTLRDEEISASAKALEATDAETAQKTVEESTDSKTEMKEDPDAFEHPTADRFSQTNEPEMPVIHPGDRTEGITVMSESDLLMFGDVEQSMAELKHGTTDGTGTPASE